MRDHEVQGRLCASTARFKVVEAGRRSGKTECAKRVGVMNAVKPHEVPDYRIGFCAPTRDQARSIYWDDLKALSRLWWSRDPSESRLEIYLTSGATIAVLGMDKPQRIEGRPWDELFIDETADMKPDVYDRHIRPTLSTDGRPGSAWFYGVPRPSSLFKRLAERGMNPELPEWEHFHWTSDTVVSADELAEAKRSMDTLTYEQEYLAKRVNFSGRVYYEFQRHIHCAARLEYDPDRPLIFTFDFNRSPGTASVLQYHDATDDLRAAVKAADPTKSLSESFSAVIGEVWIASNSTTPMVCRRLVQDWGHHEGQVLVYGDASGGAKRSDSVMGGAWDLVKAEFLGKFDAHYFVPKSNPAVQDRIVAMNTRLCAADGTVSMLLDPVNAPRLADDFDSVTIVEGSAGEIDKDRDKELTHVSDGVGYQVWKEHRTQKMEGRFGTY